MEEFKSYIVYSHTLSDGRRYIGITCQSPNRRWRNGDAYRNQNTYFARAIEKYGWDAFDHEILYEGLTEQEAKAKEVELIAKYKTQDRSHGFNLTGGGEGGFNPSEETRRKIGEASRNRMLGTRHTDEYKKHMSNRMKENNPNAGGKCLTQERIDRFTEYAKKPKTDEQKKKMSRSAKKRKVICVETGRIFGSMKEASEELGIGYTTITCAVYDPHRRAGGYHWRTYEGIHSI